MSTYYHIFNETKGDYEPEAMNYSIEEVREGLMSEALVHLKKKSKDVFSIMKSKDYILSDE